MSPLTRRRFGRRIRRGFTMIEIMVAIVLLGIIVGALMSVLMEQQRFYDGASEVMNVRDNLRRAGDLLPAEIRGIAPSYGDIYAMSDSAIDFRSVSGTSTICAFNGTKTAIIVPPPTQVANAGLTSWFARPVMTDSLFIYDPRAALPDTFIARAILAAPSAGTCPMSSGLTKTAAEEAASVTFLLDMVLPATVPAGAPVRFFRRARYSLYQSPADRLWYLGYRDYVPGRSPAWSAIQPVAGPLMPYSAQGATGLRFIYRDSLGTVLTAQADAPRVRRIDIEVRAQSASVVRAKGFRRTAAGLYMDTLRTSVAVRNY